MTEHMFDGNKIREINKTIEEEDKRRFENYQNKSTKALEKRLTENGFTITEENLLKLISIFSSHFQTRKADGGKAWTRLLCDKLDEFNIKHITEACNRKADIFIPPKRFWTPKANFLCTDCRVKNGFSQRFTKKNPAPILTLENLEAMACDKCNVEQKWRKETKTLDQNIVSASLIVSAKRKTRERWAQILNDQKQCPNARWYAFIEDDQMSNEALEKFKEKNITVVAYPKVVGIYHKKVRNSAIDIGHFIELAYGGAK